SSPPNRSRFARAPQRSSSAPCGAWGNRSMPTVSLADITPAIALGPLDGRYRKDTADLVDHLSEAALNRNRITVEIEWFIHLAQNHVIESVRRLTPDEVDGLRAFAAGFDAETIATLAAH